MRERPHLAVAIAASDTAAALAQAKAAAAWATLAEYRIDLMADFDLSRLIEASPLPAIITCRPRSQGGAFSGSEQERQGILRDAFAAGAPYVDVEAEALAGLAAAPRRQSRIIASCHDFSGMIGDWASTGLRLRALGADIVKLVGMAHQVEDVLPPLAWLAGLDAPGIGLAMGEAGLPTRLLAPRFGSAFLSFAAAAGAGTAPGQITAQEMAGPFGFHELAAADPLVIVLSPRPLPWQTIDGYRAALEEAFPAAARARLLPLPVATFPPGLLIGLRLARAAAVICLPGVERLPDLAAIGLAPSAAAWSLLPPSPPYPPLPDAPPAFAAALLRLAPSPSPLVTEPPCAS